MLLFNETDHTQVSLNDHSADLFIKHDVQVSKQSLYDRFNDKSVAFIRTLLQEQLTGQINKRVDMEALKRFSSVKIKDSTRFQLPPQFKDAYPANGGNASEAGVHIQFEFDLLSGKVSDLEVTDALKQDNNNARQTAHQVQAGSLLLRDLGYFCLDAFEQIHNRHAYYVSRMMPNVKLYELKGSSYEVLDLKKLRLKMKRYGLLHQELNVYLGDSHKMPVRLFVETLSQQQAGRRLAKAKRTAVRKGRSLTEKYKAYAVLNLFITNVPVKWLPAVQIRTLYRLRWQVELRFKVWKSLCKLHVTRKLNQYRFETYLYASLLYIIINWEIAVNMMSFIWKQHGKMISIYKYYKAIAKKVALLKDAVFDPDIYLERYLSALSKLSLYNFVVEKRKHHQSQQDILLFSLEIK